MMDTLSDRVMNARTATRSESRQGRAWPGLLLWIVLANTAAALPPDQVYAKVSPSVGLVVGLNEQGTLVSQGSGVVVADNIMVTNRHVVAPAARARVQVGGAFWDASVRCDATTRDLCLLDVTGLSAPPVEFGRTEDVRVGQAAFAIGAPNEIINALAISLATGQKPQFELTMSNGIVSSLRDTGEGPLIQTSAAISPGSSGGGLFSDEGRLIGITTFKIQGGENVNMALPVSWVRDLGVTGASLAAAGNAMPVNQPSDAPSANPEKAAGKPPARSIFGWPAAVFVILIVLMLAYGKRIVGGLADYLGASLARRDLPEPPPKAPAARPTRPNPQVERFYMPARAELKTGRRDDELWTRIIVETKGDMMVAEALYIERRAIALDREEKDRRWTAAQRGPGGAAGGKDS